MQGAAFSLWSALCNSKRIPKSSSRLPLCLSVYRAASNHSLRLGDIDIFHCFRIAVEPAIRPTMITENVPLDTFGN